MSMAQYSADLICPDVSTDRQYQYMPPSFAVMNAELMSGARGGLRIYKASVGTCGFHGRHDGDRTHDTRPAAKKGSSDPYMAGTETDWAPLVLYCINT